MSQDVLCIHTPPESTVHGITLLWTIQLNFDNILGRRADIESLKFGSCAIVSFHNSRGSQSGARVAPTLYK